MYKICRAKCPPVSVDVVDSAKEPGTHYKHQCNYEVRRRRAESRRGKIIEKIKYEYKVNVEELDPRIVDDMISKVEAIEKQKRIREKEKAERRLSFVRRLLQEEKYKRRGIKTLPPVRKKPKKPKKPKPPSPLCETPVQDPSVHGEYEFLGEFDLDFVRPQDQQTPLRKAEPAKICQNPFPRRPKPEPVEESQLQCTPPSIVFENCKPNKSYSQTYRIMNIGCDIIHCRYVGIELSDLDKDQFVPFQAEVTDNVLLRPGLSFASRIRFSSQCDVSQLHCQICYETRRKKNPQQQGIFRVPLSYVSGRSIVDVSPSVIRFPSVTWRVATGPERSKYLKQSLRIRNTGSKDCSCKIVKAGGRLQQMHSGEGAFQGENDVSEGQDEAIVILEGLIDNVFEVFRLSQRHFIPVPAMTTVRIDVEFIPEYKGYHHDVMFVRIEGSHYCTEEKIELIGDIKKIPLRIEPSTVDLKICTINSGVYEGTFRIYNDSNNTFPARLKIPSSMKEHSLVIPSCPIIQSRSYQTCSVRLFPRSNISVDAYRYYKEDTKVLEFPIFIRSSRPKACKLDNTKLYVFALLTDFTLELNPPEINFGTVNTLETIRTEISLTNHSMTELEYGFLHLPMGVRIEPNAGFGVIFPKETIPLHLLYSPVLGPADAEGRYTFRIRVTSIQELGSFREQQLNTETGTSDQLTETDVEEIVYNTEEGETPEKISFDDSTADEEDEEQSFIDIAEELKKLEEKQNRIRDYLRQKVNTLPTVKSPESAVPDADNLGGWSKRITSRKDLNAITCKAILIKPLCRLSATVLQLPATPLSSFSIKRLHLSSINPLAGEKCNCGNTGKMTKSPNRRLYEAKFEFASSSRLVSIVPRVGHIIQGQSIPITVIFKPELSKEELSYQSRLIKAEMLYEEETKSKEDPLLYKSKSKSKTGKSNRQKKLEVESHDMNLATLEITPQDLFAGQRELQQMMDPFILTLKVICKVMTLPCDGMPEKAERHCLTLVAPVIRPWFIFLGKCQEIRFGKVTVGDRARRVLEIQNISLRRIAPQVSALNPHGPFTCTTGSNLDMIDPEHIWRHPITFAPTAERGKEEEFFEIRCGATIIPLTVNGEGITPKFMITPNFELCLMEMANESITEVEFTVENTGEADLTIQFVADTIKASTNFTNEVTILETNRSKKSDFGMRKGDRRLSHTMKRRAMFSEDVPYDISTQLENDFTEVENPPENLFSISGLDSNDVIVLRPSRKVSLKIRCCPSEVEPVLDEEEIPTITAYSIKYHLLLAKTTPLKEFTIIGAMNCKS